jgi:tetratricopeptide (TPR) repeat protein
MLRAAFFFLACFTLLIIAPPSWAGEKEALLVNIKNFKAAYSRKEYKKATLFAQEAVRLGGALFGPDHKTMVTLINYLAALYKIQGIYEKAIPLLKRSLTIEENSLGREHLKVAGSLNRLAGLYYSQGRYREAVPLFERSLAIREEKLGSKHPKTAQSLNNLAELYRTGGRYKEAETLFKRSLVIKEKKLGPDHLETATSLNNLAVLYRFLGRYKEAEPLFKRSLAIRKKKLGPGHLLTVQTIHNLAVMYRAKGSYQKTVPLLKRSIALLEKKLGPDHPKVAATLNNLGELFTANGGYREAEPIFQRALAIREDKLGRNHLKTATSLNNLAILYKHQGRYGKSEPLFKRALSIRENKLGPDHPDTTISLDYLYLTSLEQSLGLDRTDKAISLDSLAELSKINGHYSKQDGITLIGVPPQPQATYDIPIISAKAGVEQIRQALELLRKVSPRSAAALETLKKNGDIVIVYDPKFPPKDISSSGGRLATFSRSLFSGKAEAGQGMIFPVVVSRYGVKWQRSELAFILAHELLGHGIQHLRGRLNSISKNDVECEARLYQEIVHQDLDLDKNSRLMVGFRQDLERRWCAPFRKYMRKNTGMELWQSRNPDVPRLLTLFEKYLHTTRN